MRTTLEDLLERAERLANHGTTLRGSLDRHQQAPELADRKLAEFNRTEAFNVAPEAHKTALRGSTLQKILDDVTVAAEVDTFLIESQAPALLRDVAALKAQARRAPGPVQHYLNRTGGTSFHLTDQTELAIRQYDMTTQLYLLEAPRPGAPLGWPVNTNRSGTVIPTRQGPGSASSRSTGTGAPRQALRRSPRRHGCNG